jgi:hypothetical protein
VCSNVKQNEKQPGVFHHCSPVKAFNPINREEAGLPDDNDFKKRSSIVNGGCHSN